MKPLTRADFVAWGAKGGANSRKNLTAAQRKKLAQKAAKAMWAKRRAAEES